MKDLLVRCLAIFQNIQNSRRGSIGAIDSHYLPQINRTRIDDIVDDITDIFQYPTFANEFNSVAQEVNQTAVEKGWWKGERNEGELIALMHSELSEALEALRHGNPPDDKIPQFSGVEAELADVIIRIMDMAAAKKYRVGEAVVAKILFNKGRAYKHGGKRF